MVVIKKRRLFASVVLASSLWVASSGGAFAFSCGNCAKEVTQWVKWAQQLKMMSETLEDWTKQLNYMDIAGKVLGSDQLSKIFPESGDWTVQDAAKMTSDMQSIYDNISQTVYTLKGMHVDLDPQSAKNINNWMNEFERLYPGYANGRRNDDPCKMTVTGTTGKTVTVDVCGNENNSRDLRSIGASERVMSQSATAEAAVNNVLNKQASQSAGLETLKQNNEKAVGLMQALQVGNAINLEIARGQQLLQALQARVAAAQLAEIEDRKQKEIDAKNTERAVLNYRNGNIIDENATFAPAPTSFNIRNAPRPK